MKIGLVSLGCPKNLVDSEVMLGLVREAGHEITANAVDADVIVVNTCAFVDSASEESVNTILEMATLKKQGACRRLVVAGCLAERYRDRLRKEMPEIDAIVGTGELPDIVSVIDGEKTGPAVAPLWKSRRGATHATLGPPTYIYDANTPRVRTTPQHYAYLKIAEGCDYKCAFCVIPKLRGHYRSRSVSSVVEEARKMAAGGVRELILVSQDTTLFGVDRGERAAIARLMRQLNTVEGLEWIRLLYLYPTTVSDDMLEAMAECEKVCNYVDLPLQHVSSELLRRMKRPGNRRAYVKLTDKIRRRVPGVTLRTTFIVGFPGETETDIGELCDFMREIEFDHVGVLTYSHERGTAAHRMLDDVPAGVKRRRRAVVMTLQRRLAAQAQRRRIGERVRMLVDGTSAEHDLVVQGRLEGQAPEIDPVVYLTDCDTSRYRAGRFVDVEIVDASGYDLLARPLP